MDRILEFSRTPIVLVADDEREPVFAGDPIASHPAGLLTGSPHTGTNVPPDANHEKRDDRCLETHRERPWHGVTS